MIKRIHVDQHAIKRNNIFKVIDGEGAKLDPPISVKTYKSNMKCFEVEIEGPSKLVYRPEKPLSCGAKLWIETTSEVVADGEKV